MGARDPSSRDLASGSKSDTLGYWESPVGSPSNVPLRTVQGPFPLDRVTGWGLTSSLTQLWFLDFWGFVFVFVLLS